MRDAVQEVGRAVERVDDPAVLRIDPAVAAALLEQHPIAGARSCQFGL